MEEALMKRVMPNSLEAEQSVIGSMIMDREAIIAASEILLKEDFYHQQYGVLFEAMVELFNEGQPADLVTLQNRLKEKMFRRRSAASSTSGILWRRFRPRRM